MAVLPHTLRMTRIKGYATDTVEPHGEAAHRCEGGRTGLERIDFPRLIRGELSAGFDAQRGRDNRGDRVPRFRVADRLQDLGLQGGPLRLLFGSTPARQQPPQMRRTPLVTTLSDQTEQGASSSNTVLPALVQQLFKVPRRCQLQSSPPAVRRRLELQPFRDAATREPCPPPYLAAGKPLISERIDGGEYLLPRRPVRKAGLQKVSGCGDVGRVGQQRPAGRTAVQVHLLFDGLPQVLHDMEPVGDLLRLRCPSPCSLGVETAAISADHFHLGMSFQPVSAGDHITILENINDHATLQIDNDRAVGLRLPPAPVVDPDDRRRLGSVLSTVLQLPKRRVIADPKAQTMQEPLGRPPTGRMPKMTDNLADTCGATCKRKRYRGDLIRERRRGQADAKHRQRQTWRAAVTPSP